jgi:hypothetical protein
MAAPRASSCSSLSLAYSKSLSPPLLHRTLSPLTRPWTIMAEANTSARLRRTKPSHGIPSASPPLSAPRQGRGDPNAASSHDDVISSSNFNSLNAPSWTPFTTRVCLHLSFRPPYLTCVSVLRTHRSLVDSHLSSIHPILFHPPSRANNGEAQEENRVRRRLEIISGSRKSPVAHLSRDRLAAATRATRIEWYHL